MLVDIPAIWAEQLEAKAAAIDDLLRYKSKSQRIRIDLRWLTADEITRLETIAKTVKGHGWQTLLNSVKTFRLLKADPNAVVITDVRALETALVEHFMKTPNKWVFLARGPHRIPYYVTSVKYTPPHREDNHTTPAFTQLNMDSADGSRSVSWRAGELRDDNGESLTLTQILAEGDLYTEDKVTVGLYMLEVERYKEVVEQIGAQYAAVGEATVVTSSWYSGYEQVSMEREGAPSKVVIDDGSESNKDDDDDTPRYLHRRSANRSRNKRSKGTADGRFWREVADPELAGKTKDKWKRRDDDEENATDDDVVALPLHPWVPVFDLHRHQFLDCHINDLEPWPFDKDLGGKLVLPEDTMSLLGMLMSGSNDVMEDIVLGKTGGTIVIATGPPGTGKTLTAEVFSEIMEKPLYVVQCSQLGLDPPALEKELGIVLARASRWKAILLIDEADVYVRARGDDIMQNAMVGVWLRVLEYYRGVLFMTSNRSTIIDDAVMSRATAWVKYELPTEAELVKLWRVLSTQYQVDLGAQLPVKLAQRWPKASGRNVKNLLKLTRKWAKDGAPTLAQFEVAARFLDVPDKKKPQPQTEEQS